MLVRLFAAAALTVFLCHLPVSHARSSDSPKQTITPPQPMREFRAAWVATVDNIDWPSKRGLPVEQQKSEIIAILDKAADLHLNAIILQVRPACDALYPSKLEPWSEYLTGEMGKAPSPFYDPLKLWIDEAHKRGMELHCWFNPYRAHHPSAKGPISSDHISKTKPSITKKYGSHLWLDPGEKDTQDHSIAVVMDVVNRYDCDAIHFDDYFYPYKEKDSKGNTIDFPDDPSWRKYRQTGGSLNREDWRRENVNMFVERLYREIKAAKPWVKLGISPFGIWRPGYPAQVKGFDQYSQLYADARKWLQEGWVDYWTPQLYWPIAQTPQSYPVLLQWWKEQNLKRRNLWPGNYTSRVGSGAEKGWRPEEIVYQVKTTRGIEGATGNVHFSMVTLMRNQGLCDLLKRDVYGEQALIPSSSWLDSTLPDMPDIKPGSGSVSWSHQGKKAEWLWLVQTRVKDSWETRILSASQHSCSIGGRVEVVAVRAVDRCGNLSDPAVTEIR